MGDNTQLGVAQVPIRATLDELDKDLDDAKKKIDKGLTGAMGAIGSSLGKIGGAAILGGLTVAVAAVTAIGTAAFASAEQLDGAYDTISVATGAVGDDLEGLKDDFRDVFKDVPGDADTLAGVIGALNSRLGATGDELKGLAKPLMEASRLMGGDAKTNTELFTRVLGDWGVATEDGAKTLDKFFAASQKSGIGMDQLMTKVVQFGAPLRLMGFSLDDSIAIFAKWEKEGVNAELVMGSLRIAAGKFADAGVPLRESLLATFDSIKNNTDASAALAEGMDVFGARAGPDMVAAIREGRFAFEDLLPVLQGSEGAILNAAAAAEDWGEKVAKMKHKAMVALEPLGMALMDLASKVLDRLAPAFDRLIPLIGEKLAPAIERVASAFGMLLDGNIAGAFETLFGPEVAGQIMAVVNTLTALVGTIVTFVTEHAEAFKGALIAIGAVLAAAAIVMGILALVSAIAALANPVTAVILLVGLLGAAWASNWGGIQEKTQAVIDFITPYIQAALEAIRAFWDEHGAAIISVVTTLWEGIKTLISNAIYVVKAIIDTVLAAIGGDWDAFWLGLKRIANNALDLIRDLIRTVLSVISQLFGVNTDEVEQTVTRFFANLRFTFNEKLEEIRQFVETVLNGIRDFWQAHGEEIMGVLEAMWDFIVDLFDIALDAIKDLVLILTGVLKGEWDDVGLKLLAITRVMWDRIRSAIKDHSTKIVDAIKTLVKTVLSVFSGVDWPKIGTDIVEGIKSGLSQALAGLVARAVEIARAAFEAAKGALGIGSPSKVMEEGVGRPFVEGIGVGITKEMPGLKDLVREGMKSLGEETGKALGQGIEDSIEEPIKKIERMIERVIGRAKELLEDKLPDELNPPIKKILDGLEDKLPDELNPPIKKILEGTKMPVEINPPIMKKLGQEMREEWINPPILEPKGLYGEGGKMINNFWTINPSYRQAESEGDLRNTIRALQMAVT